MTLFPAETKYNKSPQNPLNKEFCGDICCYFALLLHFAAELLLKKAGKLPFVEVKLSAEDKIQIMLAGDHL